MNNEIVKDELYAVLLDEICQLALSSKIYLCHDYMNRNDHYEKRRDLNDIVFVLNKPNKSNDNIKEYVTGSLIKKNGRLFFKPTCFDSEILVASDAAIFDVERFNSGYLSNVFYSDFSSLYG